MVVRALAVDNTALRCAVAPARSGTNVPTDRSSRTTPKLLWIVPVVTFLGWVIYSNSKQAGPVSTETGTISSADTSSVPMAKHQSEPENAKTADPPTAPPPIVNVTIRAYDLITNPYAHQGKRVFLDGASYPDRKSTRLNS